jgi:hypothetical protein
MTNDTAPNAPSTTVAPPPRSRAQRITLYVLLGLLSLLFLFVGALKVGGVDPMMTNMAAINYGTAATMLIGWTEITAVAGLWWRPTRLLSLSVLLLMMAGAAGSHLGAGDPVATVIPQFVIALVIAGTIFADQGRTALAFLLGSSPRPATG